MLLSALAVCMFGQSAENDDRMKKIREEISIRRQAREAVAGEQGVVVLPVAYPENWFATPQEISINGREIIYCAPLLASLFNNELMVSARVAKRRIVLAPARFQREEARAKIKEALAAVGVAIVPIGSRITVLVDFEDAPKGAK